MNIHKRVDTGEVMSHSCISYLNHMKTIQLAPRLRYVQLSDDQGEFGLLIAHEGDHINYTIQVESYDELKAKLETVLGLATGAGSTVKNEALAQTAESAPFSTADEPTIVAAPAPAPAAVATEEDDTLSYFAQMAAED